MLTHDCHQVQRSYQRAHYELKHDLAPNTSLITDEVGPWCVSGVISRLVPTIATSTKGTNEGGVASIKTDFSGWGHH